MEGTDGVPTDCVGEFKQLNCLYGETHVMGSGMCRACHGTAMRTLRGGALKLAFQHEGNAFTSGLCNWCDTDISATQPNFPSTCRGATGPTTWSPIHIWKTPWGAEIQHCSAICMREHQEANVMFAWQLHLFARPCLRTSE
jgi:hypothetical protein